MARPRKDKDAVSEPSEEFKAFENLAKKILSVPKDEIDKRESEFKRIRSIPSRTQGLGSRSQGTSH